MTNPILYETSTPGIARIILNRPETRNAQDTAFLYALNEAFDRAALDDGVKVIVLSANGPHFSSGHDLREADGHGNMKKHDTVGTWGSMSASASAGATFPSPPWRWSRAR
jgi:enoyl-CoA hydratase